MQDTSHHAANLLIAETKHDNCPKNCVQHLEWLDTLTENDTCPLTVIADNFHDFDGYFVVDEFHRRHWQIGQIHNGSKLMQVTPDQICFIDLPSSFQKPLSAFPKTFGIEELKGFFPHLFNNPNNQEYMGPIPDEKYYMPETMSVHGCKAFENGMLNKSTIKFISILAGNWWNISNLMSSFWMLVAWSSKQSLRKNQSNPFDRMTIASTCNQDLCQNSMLPNTIASEPMHGWTVSSSAASQTERQTHLSALSQLCGRGNG